MFKLIKIMNSGVNVPEVEKLNCDTSTISEAGTCAYYDKSYGQLLMCGDTQTPTHVLLQNINEGDSLVLCYSVLPQMIFETTLIGDPTPLYEGMTVKLVTDNNIGTYAVSDVEGGSATIYSLQDAKKSGDKILVIFDGRNN